MAESVVSNVAARLGELVIQEAKFLQGVENEVNRLQTELGRMKSFLKEADSRQAEDERVRNWVADIRDIAYDAEDVIETFALKIASRRTGGISNVIKRSACFLKEGRMLHKVRSDIEQIRSKITDLAQSLQTYGIKGLSEGGSSSSSSSKRQKLRQPFPHIVDANVVGLDDDIEELVSVLVDEERQFRVASICGMGGQGKTTLAKKVYHHSQVRNHFKHFDWAYISQQCQRKAVWRGILSSLGLHDEKGGILNLEDDQELAGKLYNFLKEKKCLVVLDDIWSTEDWDMIKAAFPMEENTAGSKILLTSRNKDLALYADSRGYLHELKCLTDEDGWKLFQRITFPRGDSADYIIEEKMKELGKDMVKQCAGLPLAIVVLGGILATKHSLNDWLMVHENVKSNLRRGRGTGTWGIHETLSLSYDDLPAYLKPCFLYLSVFPEDYEIHVDRLIQLWVAEDIVPLEESEGNGEELAEDVAERYLNELVERYMVLVGERDASFKIKTCRMHDLIRDLCLLKSKQENFMHIVDGPKMMQAGLVSISSSAIGKVCRLSMHDSFLMINRIKNPRLRSLFFIHHNVLLELLPILDWSRFFKQSYIWFQKRADDLNCVDCCLGVLLIPFLLIFYIHKIRGLMRHICKNFKMLRVLDFEGTHISLGCNLHHDIGSLFHLRFLSLRAFLDLLRLPESIRKLRCLLTLDLRGFSVHVPNVLWRMERLRHLYLPRKHFCQKTKLKLDALRNLQTLVNFNTKNCYLGDLFYMKKLKKLEISTPFFVENFREDLNLNRPIIASKHLRSLRISSDKNVDPRHLTCLLSGCLNICELVLFVEIRKLPQPQYLSPNLAYIFLARSQLEEDPMPTLEKLPTLRVLKLGGGAFNGNVLACSAQGFPQLDSLSVVDQANLEELRVSEGAMPNLRHLGIAACVKLKMLPDELRFITALKELKIEKMSKEFKEKLVRGGEYFYKVQHVPSVIFKDCDH